MKGGGILSFLLIAIIGFQCILADEKCEVISNHTINGIEYRECKDGRLMKVMKVEKLKENGKSESDDINLSEVGVISGDEEFLKDLSKSPKKDESFDNHFGKQREIREKVHSLQESLKKKRNESAAKNHGRKFGVIYKHNGFDEGSNSRHYESDEESDEEMEDETVGGKDAMIKATVAETETTMSPLSLGDGINDTPEGVDVKEMIARAHHKDYHKNPKQANVDSESAKSEHPAATHQPHDPMHFGNLRFLDFAPETTDKPKSDTPTPESDSDSEESESLLLPETPNQQQQLPPNPYFLALANNPIKIPAVQQSRQKETENVFNDVRKAFASATPISNSDRRHDDSTAAYYSIIKPQILLAFLAPITAFLIYCTIVLFYIYRKKSSSQRKLLPTKNCRYQHFNEDAEATVGFAV